MSNLIPFQFESHQVRTVTDDAGEVWVVVADIASAIEYSNTSRLVELIDEDDLTKREVIDSLGRTQFVWVTNESGTYQALLRANVPKAKPFRKWVTAEVLPAIRRTGGYGDQSKPVLPRVSAMEYVRVIREFLPNLGESSIQQMLSAASEIDLGRPLIPAPVIKEKFYTATELAEEFGVSANKIGRVANAHGLKTPEFGEYRLSKSKHSARQVEQFHYNERGREALALALCVTAGVN